MSIMLKQSTATTLVLGPFLDSTTGVDPETALTIAQADVRLSKNGGAFAQKGDATSCSHMENGYYSCPLDATDTGTLGRLFVAVNEAGALPVWMEYQVVPANVYDSLVGGSDTLQADLTQISGAAVSASSAQLGVNVVQVSSDATAADNAEAFFDGTGYAGTNNVIPTVTTLTNKDGFRLSATGVDDILDEAITEPASVPAWPATLRTLVGWLGALARNKITQTATTQTLYADDTTTSISTSSVSDDGSVFSRGEWS